MRDMRTWGTRRWQELRDSLWFVPSVITALSVALAFGTLLLDHSLIDDRIVETPWIFGGGAEGARGVLSAIAGTMITVTALVFSITVVALQLASSQLSPRILRSFMGDRGHQVVLGFFIGTFTYSLLVLRSVRAPLEDGGGFVPSLSVSTGIALALVSVGLLIYFVHHSANSMRTSVVIARAAALARDLVEHLYPEDVGNPAPEPVIDQLIWRAAVPIVATEGGYLEGIDAEELFAAARESSTIVRQEALIGSFLLPGATLARVAPVDRVDDELIGRIRAAMLLGPERTGHEDIDFAVGQLSDIAVKALSPGINDPATAVMCIDRLAEVIVLLARRGAPREVRTGDDGQARLILKGPPFEQIVGAAFDQVRHYGIGDPVVAAHLAAVLGQAAALVPPERRLPLAHQARLTAMEASRRLTLPEDIARVETAASWVSRIDAVSGLAVGQERAVR
jgi:uncharacterized membrane protein